MIFIISESYAPVLLERKAEHLRRETGNLRLVSKLHSGLSSSDHFKRSIVRPMKMLSHSPIVLLLSIHMAIVYGYLYLLFTTVTEVFETTYAFSSGVVGLTFLGLGMGMLFGLAIFGFVTNVIFKRYAVDGVMKPEYRFLPMIPGALCIPIGMFLYGWTAQYHIFWFVPIVGTCLVGLGIITTFVSSNLPVSLLSHSTFKHLHRFPQLVINNAVSFLHHSQQDAHNHLSRRRLHPARRISTRRKHRPSIHRWGTASSRRTENVLRPGLGVGKLTPGICLPGNGADTIPVLQIWRTHED